jgi:hypothetical protein
LPEESWKRNEKNKKGEIIYFPFVFLNFFADERRKKKKRRRDKENKEGGK